MANNLTFKQITGLVNTDNMEVGLGRLDIAPFGSNNLLPVGALEGVATSTLTRTGVEIKAGVPLEFIKKVITEEGATLKVTLLETSVKRAFEVLGTPSSTYNEVGGAVLAELEDLVTLKGQTPAKLTFGGLTSTSDLVVANTSMNQNENLGVTNGTASQAFVVSHSPILSNAASLFLTVGGVAYTVLIGSVFPKVVNAGSLAPSSSISATNEPVSPTRLRVTVSGAGAPWGTITIAGKNALSASISEVLTFTGNGTIVTVNSFASIDTSGITANGTWPGSFTVSIDGSDQLAALVAAGNSGNAVTFGDNIDAIIPPVGQTVLFSYRSTTISGEIVGTSTGLASQTFNLKWVPITATSETISVGGTNWTRVTSFSNQLATAQIYTITNTTGLITFGNGTNGAIPPNGVTIIAAYIPTTTVYVVGGGSPDVIVDLSGGYIIRVSTGTAPSGLVYSVTYKYVQIISQKLTLGGYNSIQEWHVQFTHPMIDNVRFEIIELYRAVGANNFNLPFNSTAVNSREIEFTALADFNRGKGDHIGNYRMDSSPPGFF